MTVITTSDTNVKPYRTLMANTTPSLSTKKPPMNGERIPTKVGIEVKAAKPRPLRPGSIESARRADEAGNLKTSRPLKKLAAARNLQSGANM
jgi:hypothetical protein